MMPPATQLPELANDDALAKYAFRLALTFGRWVRRRIESFEFVDATTVRRRMSVDFALPEDPSLESGKLVYVPVMILKKEDLRNFDLRNEQDHSLHLLTSGENGQLAIEGMEKFLGGIFQPVPKDVIAGFIEEEDRREATKRAKKALSGGGSIGRPLADWADINERNQVRALITDLAGGFMVLVPIVYLPGQRQLVKLSYDAAHRLRPWRAESEGWFGRFADVAFYLSSMTGRFFSSFGLVARQESFSGLAGGWAQSYHAEVIPPVDCRAVSVELEVDRQTAARDSHPSRPHVRVSDAGRGASTRLSVLLLANRGSLLLPLWASAAAIAGCLAFIPSRHTTLDTPVLAALLLVPFALAAFYIRAGENSYVTKFLSGVRLVAAVPVLSGVTVLAMIGLKFFSGDTSETAEDVATWCAHLALWSVVVLTLALASPVAGQIGRPIVRFVQKRTIEWPGWLRFFVLGGLISVGALPLLAVGGAILIGLYALLPI